MKRPPKSLLNRAWMPRAEKSEAEAQSQSTVMLAVQKDAKEVKSEAAEISEDEDLRRVDGRKLKTKETMDTNEGPMPEMTGAMKDMKTTQIGALETVTTLAMIALVVAVVAVVLKDPSISYPSRLKTLLDHHRLLQTPDKANHSHYPLEPLFLIPMLSHSYLLLLLPLISDPLLLSNREQKSKSARVALNKVIGARLLQFVVVTLNRLEFASNVYVYREEYSRALTGVTETLFTFIETGK
jgi:hypothetical protein